jgi:hypothetical protein
MIVTQAFPLLFIQNSEGKSSEKGIHPRGLFDESDSDVQVIEYHYVEEIYVPINESLSSSECWITDKKKNESNM